MQTIEESFLAPLLSDTGLQGSCMQLVRRTWKYIFPLTTMLKYTCVGRGVCGIEVGCTFDKSVKARFFSLNVISFT